MHISNIGYLICTTLSIEVCFQMNGHREPVSLHKYREVKLNHLKFALCRNLSSNGLHGDISSSFTNLKAVKYLYVWSTKSILA